MDEKNTKLRDVHLHGHPLINICSNLNNGIIPEFFSIRMYKNFLILTYKNFFLYGFILLHKSYLIDFANLLTLMSYKLDTYLSLVLEGRRWDFVFFELEF